MPEPKISYTGPQPGKPDRTGGFPWQHLLLGLVLALAFAVRCTTLSFQSLWLDEIYTTVEASRPLGELVLALFRPTQAYPLYILGMRVWTALFGTSEVALRLPSALFGFACVSLLYLLGRRLYGWRVGLSAAALLAISPLAVWYSQDAKAYALSILLSILTWLLLWEALERPSKKTWWAFGLTTGLAFFSHRLIAVLCIVGQLLYALYIIGQKHTKIRRGRLTAGLLLVVLLLSIAGLWFTLGWGEASRQFGSEYDWSALPNTFSQFSLRIPPTPPELGQGPDRRPWLLAFGFATLAGLLALVADWRKHGPSRQRAAFLLSFLLVPTAVFFLLYLVRPFYHERYLLGSLPAYLLLLAIGVDRLWHWADRLGRQKKGWPSLVLRAAAMFVLLIPLAVSWCQVQDWSLAYRPSKEQFRETTRYLQEHFHPGDLLIVLPSYIQPAVEFYQDRWPRVPLTIQTLPNLYTEDYGFREFEADMDDRSRGRRRAWLYLAPYHSYAQDPKSWVYEWFNLNPFDHCGEAHFNGLDLYCVTFNAERRVGFPQPSISLQAPFEKTIQITGADLEPFQQPLLPGDILPLTLYVKSMHENIPDLETGVRLVGSDGMVWAESIGQPLAGFLPTSRWKPSDDFLDYHELLLPQEIPPGIYQVQVGYRPLSESGGWLELPSGATWSNVGKVEVAQ